MYRCLFYGARIRFAGHTKCASLNIIRPRSIFSRVKYSTYWCQLVTSFTIHTIRLNTSINITTINSHSKENDKMNVITKEATAL